MAAEGIHDLPIVGGHPALDLVNTVEPRYAAAKHREHLIAPVDLLAWAGRAGLLSAAESAEVSRRWQAARTSGPDDLAAATGLREQLYAALAALMASRTPDLAAITLAWAQAVSRTSLEAGPDGVRLHPAVSIPDRLAFAAVDLLTTVDLSRLRACPPDEGGCGWLFLDHTRNNSRRWCVMADCGTQAKSRKLTERRRSSRVAARAAV